MKKYFAFLVISIGFITCTKSSTTIKIVELIPLQVGNQWHYDDISFNYDGDTLGISEAIMQVSDSLQIHNETWFEGVFKHEGFYRSTTDRVYFQLYSTDPQYFIQFGKTSLPSETLVDSVYDLHTREQLVAFSELQHINGYDGVIKNVDSFTYDIFTLPYFYNDIFIKPGLGIVQVDLYESENGISGGAPFHLTTQLILKSYTLK